MEFVSKKLNSIYEELEGDYEFGYYGEGQPLDSGLPSSEYLLIKPYYSMTGDPSVVVVTPSASLISYLYDAESNNWKALKYSTTGNMGDLRGKLDKMVNPPVWKE